MPVSRIAPLLSSLSPLKKEEEEKKTGRAAKTANMEKTGQPMGKQPQPVDFPQVQIGLQP
jgi:hypothetical protein